MCREPSCFVGVCAVETGGSFDQNGLRLALFSATSISFATLQFQ